MRKVVALEDKSKLQVDIVEKFKRVRALSRALAAPLTVEDMVVQTMPDVSPTKWHLAHTSWYFETFLLTECWPGYEPFHPEFCYLFNSYYNAVGPQFSRPARGHLSRPTVDEIWAYRTHVDRWMVELLSADLETLTPAHLAIAELGLHHEQQHQELLLTDIKHILGTNPLMPAYLAEEHVPAAAPPALSWHSFMAEGGLFQLGAGAGDDGFSFDNEGPQHRVYIAPFSLASRLTTAGEYMAFLNDGGYKRPEFWLSEGWSTVQAEGWEAPLYWFQRDGSWWHYTMGGARPVDPHEPVCHVSLYEADAFAGWAGKRLPSEAEWELVARPQEPQGNFVDDKRFHPSAALASASVGSTLQMYGDVWEWTTSSYAPYPGYQAPAGAIGEYNGKFMCSQMVLRGGSCATSRDHVRPTYRNFFYPASRWQFSGIRLAQDT